MQSVTYDSLHSLRRLWGILLVCLGWGMGWGGGSGNE